MKLSLSKFVLSVAALLCLEPTSIMAQTKRSLTDVPGMSQWLAEDALTFAQSVYDTYSALQEQSPARTASLTEMGLPSSCGWTCYPSDYSCYTYDFGYRSPAEYSPLAVQKKPSSAVAARQQDARTALCGIPDDEVYPCMIHDDEAFEPSAVTQWIRDAADATRNVAAAAFEQFEQLAENAADALKLSNAWMADAASAEADRLVIRPLEDIHPELDSSNSELANAKPAFVDYEWEVALDYFAQYGCPEVVWSDERLEDNNIAAPELIIVQRDPIKLWVAQMAGRMVGNAIVRSGWYNAASDLIASVQAEREEMIARAQVPPVPAEEFMLDHETFVVIANPSTPASIPSLARAVMAVVRETWAGTISTAAADRILR